MFKGNVSCYNRGGFSSFRIIPDDKKELTRALNGITGFIIEVKRSVDINPRFKFQLTNESHMKSFNWQAGFYTEQKDTFEKIYLDIKDFWPNLFGHVLSKPGNINMAKVDCLGFMISHVTVDGKKNPDFKEGEFDLAIKSVKFVYKS